MNEQAGTFDFLTNHARVLIVIARDPAARLRDIAAACDITQRTAQSIVNDLDQAGYLRRERNGRRTHYSLCLAGTLRHPADAHVPVQGLLELFTAQSSKRV
ncbi:helix-turn-helix domain-containing protein [Streptomyces sp. NBC_00687]|uniref:helix-turn-helix transcriptional regulator n=1 Tax=Streptomyces sp. NBC_00687 TaxID=2975807 RepID=UPI002258E908|nr:helix-turn-helix domain-containing protein [Streptomyces sp. NBC_00687]MCX4920070.1 winged helix-turn-helix domain-containing protein [Streptomyces sp. NBC_00687]